MSDRPSDGQGPEGLSLSRLLSGAMVLIAVLFVGSLGGLAPSSLPGPGPLLLLLAALGSLRWLLASARRSGRARLRQTVRRHAWSLGLLGIVCLYLAIQLPGLYLGLGYAPLHVDEHRLAATASSFFLDGTVPHETVEDYPGVFYWLVVGTYVLGFLVLLMQETLWSFSEIPATTLIAIGRTLTTVVYGAVIVLTAIVARRLPRRDFSGSALVGLMAASAMAISPLGLRVTSEFRNDPGFVLLTIAAVFAALVLRDRGDGPTALLVGGLAGLAAGVKYTGVFTLLPGLIAILLADARGSRRSRLALTMVGGFVVALGVSNHFLWWDFPNFIEQLGTEVQFTGAQHWSATDNPRGFYSEYLAWGLGPPLLLLAAAGLARTLVARQPGAWILASFVIPYWMFMSNRPAQFDRWVYPLLPFAAAFGAWAAGGMVRWLQDALRRHGPGSRKWPAVATTVVVWAVVLLPLVYNGAELTSRRLAPSTYERVEAWVLANSVPGDRILTERWWFEGALPDRQVERTVLTAAIERELFLGSFDWMIAPEPVMADVAQRLGQEPVETVLAGYRFGGSRGFDFAVHAPPVPQQRLRSLSVPLGGPRAVPFLGDGWGPPESGDGRLLSGPGELFLPLVPERDYVLTAELELDAPFTAAGEALLTARLEDTPLEPVEQACLPSKAALLLAQCRFLIPASTIPERVAVLELRASRGRHVWVRHLAVGVGE